MDNKTITTNKSVSSKNKIDDNKSKKGINTKNDPQRVINRIPTNNNNINAKKNTEVRRRNHFFGSLTDNSMSQGQDKVSEFNKKSSHESYTYFGDNGDNDISESANGMLKKIMNSRLIKLIIIYAGISVLLTVILVIIMVTPLMELGIIDIEDVLPNFSGGGYSPPKENYTPVEGSSSYWWPVDSSKSTISSSYGYRFDPQTGEQKFHNGVDIVTGDGPGVIDIIAANTGTVTRVKTGCPTTISIHDADTSDDECGARYGNYVTITHNDGNVTVYAHLYSVSVNLNETVNQGQVIGKMGSSGRSTGTHLHFEVRVNGQRVNPINYVSNTNKKP